MDNKMTSATETMVPSEQDVRAARETGDRLTEMTSRKGGDRLLIRAADNPGLELAVPKIAVRLLLNVLQEMGRGNGVSISAVRKEVTTQQAAGLLGVSRPFLIDEVLGKGLIPYRLVGNRRRIRVEDLLRFREAEEREIARRDHVMRDLLDETERLGLYK